MKVSQVLVEGVAEGHILEIFEPVSFWGGVSSETGRIVDAGHPQVGRALADAILVMPHARGSSGTSSGFAELIRTGLGPAGVVLRDPDMMLVVGAMIAQRLYGKTVPIVVADIPEGASGTWRIDGQSLETSDT